ncbi:MAG TPA: metallophosphoesterase [Clostridia bacterium]|nr:metallophosphoesterase [Clostridia bacterium]
MIYITGDTHGDITRFKQFKAILPKYRHHILVCGDFGFVWDGSEREKKRLKKMERLDCNIMFVEGTHDNLDLLSDYPLEEYCGGQVRRITKNVFWMQRGELFSIEGVTIFAMGGGESSDADERQEGVNWWRGELPTIAEIEAARSAIEKAEGGVDIVITHHNPRLELGLIDTQRLTINALGVFLSDVAKAVNYRHWYFGKDHVDKTISPRMTAVFEKVILFNPNK